MGPDQESSTRTPSIEGIKNRLKEKEISGFSVDSDGILWYEGRICVPSDEDLKQLILKEAHDTLYSIHPGGTKMYQDLKEKFWWHGMKREIALFIQSCDICQRVKARASTTRWIASTSQGPRMEVG